MESLLKFLSIFPTWFVMFVITVGLFLMVFYSVKLIKVIADKIRKAEHIELGPIKIEDENAEQTSVPQATRATADPPAEAAKEPV